MTSGRPASSLNGLRFIGVFVAVFGALQLALLSSEGTAAERVVIDRATVGVAAQLVALVFPRDQVKASGPTIVSSRVRLNVLRGCEGTELMLLVIAAVCAFPAAWRARLPALLAGMAAAYVLNQLRIVALYYTVRDLPRHFELVHGYLAPTLLIACVAALFWCWTARQRDSNGRGPAVITLSA